MLTARPSHISEELVVDVDIYGLPGAEEDVFQAWRDQFLAWKHLRHGAPPPLVWTPHNGGHWIVARGVDLEVLYADADRLSNSSISIPSHGGPNIYPGESDGEEHAAYRSAVLKGLNPQVVRSLGEEIEGIAGRLIDSIEPLGSCDFVADFAYRLPIELFLTMMALPLEDGEYLLKLAHQTIRTNDDHEKGEALSSIFAYLADIVAERRSGTGNDLISQMHRTRMNGEQMPQEAVHGICVNILLGGLDTVASMLGFIMKHLAENASDRRRLSQDPDQVASSLNELIRRFPIASLGRVVAKDFEYEGIALKTGERMFLPTALHSFDDDQFEDPMRLDLDRPVKAVLSFGRGPHQCLGSYLARVELLATLTQWLQHIPEFKIAPGARISIASGAINAIKPLPLVWTPSRQA